MTREVAIESAQREAEAAGKRLAVYRFAAWRDGVFGVRDVQQLPSEALTFEIFPSVVQNDACDAHEKDNAAAAQGSLF